MKVKDGIIGLVVGDALGVPVEFYSKSELETDPVTDMEGYGTYNQPAGTWSDDSSMAIATMASISNTQEIDYEDIMSEFIEWMDNGKYTNSEDGCFDIGITTREALYNFKNGASALNSGCSGEHSNGNGSLMRILPLAFIRDIDYETIENVSALTHAHKRSKITCVLYIEIARSMIENDDLSIEQHIDSACEKIINYYKDSPELKHLENVFNKNFEEIDGKGYVINTIECVIYSLLTTNSYKDAVLKAVNIGRDTDTNAAICGGLAGIYYGYDSIPIDWISNINKIDELLSLCEKYEAFCDEN